MYAPTGFEQIRDFLGRTNNLLGEIRVLLPIEQPT
jgi:hypothetical protein